MRASVLVKALDAMYYNCKNRVIYLSFYETKGIPPRRRPSTRVEFDQNLPDMYFLALVSAGNKTLFLMKKDPGADRTKDTILSRTDSFDFDELEKSGVMNYTVHEYREVFPFGKEAVDTSISGIYKQYTECLKFDAMLYVDLFKLMGETVSLVIESRNKLYLAHFIAGRVVVTETNDWSLHVRITDFYALNTILPEYDVVDFIQYPINLSLSRFLDRLRSAAIANRLQFLEG